MSDNRLSRKDVKTMIDHLQESMQMNVDQLKKTTSAKYTDPMKMLEVILNYQRCIIGNQTQMSAALGLILTYIDNCKEDLGC